MKTFVVGKDAALEDSINFFQQQFKQQGFNIQEVSWLNPVPNVWSVHIQDADSHLCFANGKGASKKAALASALGEFFERLSTNYFFTDFYLGKTIANSDFVHYPSEKWFAIQVEDSLPAGLLTEELWDYYDPEQELVPELLVDLQSSNLERGIVALPYIRQSDQQTVYFPQSIISNLYASNGMAAGNTSYEARVQALSEIFERYVKNKIIAEAISLPEIPSSVMARYPQVVEAIAALNQSFPVFVYDASLGGKYPVICVVLLNPNNGSCYASFGAHPNFGVALERTVTELLQGRSLKELDVFPAPSFDNEAVAEHTNLETHFIDASGVISWDLLKQQSDYQFVDWDFSGSTQAEFNTLIGILARQNKDVYIMDYNHLGVEACRIIVPGISEIYPVDDLLYANNNMGMQWREIILDLAHNHHAKTEYQELLEEMVEQGIDDFTQVAEFIGIAPEGGSGFATLRMGELKSMLYLACGELTDALEWAHWTVNVNQGLLSQKRQQYYACLLNSLELYLDSKRDPLQYKIVFEAMYSPELVEYVWSAINGGNPFYDLLTDDDELNNSPTHQSVLKAYQKVQIAKQNQ